ncbi:MAG: methyltransferase domain-containing protein [Actinophytocola sp.]|uniref:class I SAM-dependent methyltransferase n=1 Tax=Actinophytocola sp. TaxID=1872138 RepID=UPI00132BF898|nr:class I SAM-dependent methyltransferase [Actinophytocola sp.]MPZ81594.1 methyltransferase domain-containing protein [Actinophytocola sp.]
MIDRTHDAAVYETICGGYDDRLFAAAAIGTTDRVLDIGCGYGRTTMEAPRRAPEGHAVGNDLAAPLLEHARRTARSENIRNITFEQGDAQVHPFPTKEFDVAISRMGTMFFADPVAAFANIGAALRPGGRLACAVTADPRENDLAMVLGSAVADHLPPRTNEIGAPGLSSLADPDRIREVLTAAGFTDTGIEKIETRIAAGRTAAEAATLILGWGAAGLDVDDATRTRMHDALAEGLRNHRHPDGIRLRSAGWLFTATCV